MDNLYLIAHRVRGEPAFDIAIRADDMGTEDDPGPWWIIPTSGHRAYPYAFWALEDLVDISDYPHQAPWTFDAAMPKDWPDHYAASSTPKSSPTPARDLLKSLGLVKSTPIKRRF